MEIPLNYEYGLSAKAFPMVERSRQDSSRDLLEELEDGWGTPPSTRLPEAPKAVVQAAADATAPTGDAARNGRREVEGRSSSFAGDAVELPQSNPDLASLDEGWLDDLFPGQEGDEGEDDDDDDDDEDEPELPDERLDPEAFALAKQAREERAAKKKEKKRAKAEAKRARQKARAVAMRQKQKSKKARPASPPRREPEPKPAKTRTSNAPKPVVAKSTAATVEHDDAELDAQTAAPSVPPQKTSAVAKRPASAVASVKLLAIVLAVLLAVAVAVAAILK